MNNKLRTIVLMAAPFLLFASSYAAFGSAVALLCVAAYAGITSAIFDAAEFVALQIERAAMDRR